MYICIYSDIDGKEINIPVHVIEREKTKKIVRSRLKRQNHLQNKGGTDMHLVIIIQREREREVSLLIDKRL